MGIFQYIGNWIDSLFDFLKNSSNTDVVQILSTLVGLTITLQIMFKAYQSFAGKSSEPVKELVWDITIRLVVIGVALNLNGYLDIIKLAMEELHNSMSGDTNLYAKLDEKFTQTLTLMNKVSTIYPDINLVGGLIELFVNLLILIGFLLGIVPSFMVVVTTGITLKLLMLIAPIVIFAWIYPWFKNVFTQWLSVFISNLLTVYMVGILLSKFSEKYGDYILKVTNNLDTDIFDIMDIGFNSLIMGILLFGLMKIAVGLADKIGTASIETLVSKEMGDSTKQGYKDTVNKGTKVLGAMRNFTQKFH
ncbi:type IV secretion system protein [Aliarcobacter butzleri]|uniref:type IV secretion system protein n=1 Tax=Aliarcobacter butzleri TaxID=28197 RepID=UPI00263E4A09|nr:type IV secretion system protein [Aliarcobacter butzleri]MDN5112937.1 type IV secretion system protein [Aliarcobacter butzleri]